MRLSIAGVLLHVAKLLGKKYHLNIGIIIRTLKIYNNKFYKDTSPTYVPDVISKKAHKVEAYAQTANEIIIIKDLLIQKLILLIIEPAMYAILNAEAASQHLAMVLPQRHETI